MISLDEIQKINKNFIQAQLIIKPTFNCYVCIYCDKRLKKHKSLQNHEQTCKFKENFPRKNDNDDGKIILNNINKIFDKNLQSINQILKNFIKNIKKEYI